MFPVSVCLRIESKRFVEEETQRKRMVRCTANPSAGLAIFRRRGHDWNYWRDMLPYNLSVL